jgi:hypothetical protein
MILIINHLILLSHNLLLIKRKICLTIRALLYSMKVLPRFKPNRVVAVEIFSLEMIVIKAISVRNLETHNRNIAWWRSTENS